MLFFDESSPWVVGKEPPPPFHIYKRSTGAKKALVEQLDSHHPRRRLHRFPRPPGAPPAIAARRFSGSRTSALHWLQGWPISTNQSCTEGNIVKNIVKASVALAVGLFGLAASSNAQTLIVGSSAFYTQAGLGAASPTSSSGVGSSCIWTQGSNAVKVVDTSIPGTTLTDSGSVFIAWAPGSDCTTTSSNSSIYVYLNTDSVVGNRALFNGDTLAAGSAGDPTTLGTTNAIAPTGSTSVTTVPPAIWSLINNHVVNAAATDIRPEDAEFAITRATTACGTAINQYTGTPTGSATQYLGLGYNNGDNIVGFTGSTFHVVKFPLPSSFNVTAVGATPIMVAVNGSNWASATNLNPGELHLEFC